MSQQEFDNFKQRIKDWMDSHPEEYDCFEEEMNRKDNAGYQKILTLAFTLVPKYQKIIRKKVNQGNYDAISDIEAVFSEINLAESIVGEFEKTSNDSIVPAMLSWLYFGRSFERMVERGEEIRKSPSSGYVDKLLVASTIKVLISKSITLGLRTKADWEEHKKLMQLAEGNDVLNWAIEETPSEKKKVGRKPDIQTLPQELLPQIEEFLQNKRTQYDIACLKIALEEMALISADGIKAFRNSLDAQFGETISIISARGIQKSYKDLTEFLEEWGCVKNLPENRAYIDEIKKFLSN